MIGNFDDEYGKILAEIIERQFVKNSSYVITRDAKEHKVMLDGGWDEVSGDESTGWVMRKDVPATSKAGGVS